MGVSTALIPQNLKEALKDFITAIKNQDAKGLNDAFGKIGVAVTSILKNFVRYIDDLVHHRHKVGPLKPQTIEEALNNPYSLLKTDLTAACTNFQASMEKIKVMMTEALKNFLHNKPILEQCSSGAAKCVEVTISTLAAGLMVAKKLEEQAKKPHSSSTSLDEAMKALKDLTSQQDMLLTQYTNNLGIMADLQRAIINGYKNTHPEATPEEIQKFTERFGSLITQISNSFTPRELLSILDKMSTEGIDAFKDFGEKGEKVLSEWAKFTTEFGIDGATVKSALQLAETSLNNYLIPVQLEAIRTKVEGILTASGITLDTKPTPSDKESSEKSTGSYHTPTCTPPIDRK